MSQAKREAARSIGIVLTPRGEPLFARDSDRWAALGILPLPLSAEARALLSGSFTDAQVDTLAALERDARYPQTHVIDLGEALERGAR